MNEPECTDLVCRARREELAREEWRRLERLRVTSWDVRLTEAILNELDTESVVQTRDNELVGRIVDGALSRRKVPYSLRARKSGWILAALVLTTVGAAGAAAGVLWTTQRVVHHGRVAVSSSAASNAGEQRCASTAPTGDSVAGDEKNSTSGSGDSDTKVNSNNVRVRSLAAESGAAHFGARSAKSVRPEVTDSKSLFAKANLLRRQGESTQAMAVYRILVQEFPAAQEVPLARLALAKLLMASSPNDAMAHFNVLTQSSTALRAEGLWGMAEAARRLGKTSAERNALGLLVRDFPDTPYAEVARKRLTNEGD